MGKIMNMLNVKVNINTILIAIFSLVLVACNGGSASSYTAASNKATPSPAPVVSPTAPTVTVSASKTIVSYNEASTITWSSTNSTSCSNSNGSGGTGTAGSFNTGALTTTTTYSVTCTGAGGSATQSKTITVNLSNITAFANSNDGQHVTVTSANSLINGTNITISGTTNYNGPYVVSSVTSTTFRIVATYISNDATGTWQSTGGNIPSCSSTGNTGAISLVNQPSRYSGVAPLSVFFDASATTATGKKAFHELEYRWDFGDKTNSNQNLSPPLTGSSSWSTGSRPGVSNRNVALGPVAAHVFETPGTYIVSITASDGSNSASNACAQIVVQDPNVVFAGTNTVCVGSNSLPVQNAGGCPAGASVVQQSNFGTSINTYALTGKRLLFRRGDTFTSSASGTVTGTGPGIIGSFGTGVPPLVQRNTSSSSQILVLSSSSTPGINDWRVMDIDFDGRSAVNDTNVGIVGGGGINQVLIIRMNLTNLYRGIEAGPWGLDYNNSHGSGGHTIFDEWSIVDNYIRGIPGCPAFTCDWRVYLAGKHVSIQGNDLDNQDTGGSHVVRSEYMGKGVISNNTIARAGATQHAIKLHAWDWATASVANPGGVGTYTEKIVISDNKIIGNVNAWTVSIGPQNDGTVPGQPADERVRDVIFERNWITSGPGTFYSVETSAVDTTIRNNIIDMTGATYQYAIHVGRRGTEPVPNNVNLFNNTIYARTSPNETWGIDLGSISTVNIKNNLVSARAASSPLLISGSGAGLVQSNNSTNAQIKSTLPGWVSSTPSTPADFTLVSGSYALGSGGSVPVYSDFFLKTRTNSDLGAVEP